MTSDSKILSFEVFPPTTQVGSSHLVKTLDSLRALSPDFISVTCSNNNYENIADTTIKFADYVNNTLNIPAVAHLPAAYLDKTQVIEILERLREKQTMKVLALRGDISDEATKKDFKYASDLVKFIKDYDSSFEVLGACYPDVHPESINRISDFHYLKEKVDSGADKLITQLFFDNNSFYDFQERCAIAEINVPILAGIMPVINRNQILRLLKNCNTPLPAKFIRILEKYEHNPVALRDAGIAYAIDQIVDLVTEDVAGIHLYTINNSETARSIHSSISSLFKINT